MAQEHGRHSCKAETAAGAAATIRGPRPMPGWARMGAAAAYWTRGGLRTEDPLGRQRDAHQAQESGATVRRDGRRREDAAQRRPRASARRIAHCPWASLLTHRGRAPPPWDKQKILFGKKIVQPRSALQLYRTAGQPSDKSAARHSACAQRPSSRSVLIWEATSSHMLMSQFEVARGAPPL